MPPQPPSPSDPGPEDLGNIALAAIGFAWQARRRIASGTERYMLLVLAVTLFLSACGGGDMSLAEYADEVEDIVADMRSRIVATDDALTQPITSIAITERIWRERASARQEFLDAFATIEPPDEAEPLHAAATDIVRRLSDAEAAIADQVRDYDEPSQLTNLGPTPAFRTFIAVNDEATAVCLAAQGMFDDTKRREVLRDVPWLTSELKTVIEIVFDCVPGES